MKLYNQLEVSREFNYIQRYSNGWNPDTMQPMERDRDKYWRLKQELSDKYEGKYDAIRLWNEFTINIGDRIETHWMSGNMYGEVIEINVYFSTVSYETEYIIKIKDKYDKIISVEKYNSPCLISNQEGGEL